MHPSMIQAALKVRGMSQTSLASECGVMKSTVCNVIQGRRRSKRIERRIAATIGQSLGAIWPKWYENAEPPPRPFTATVDDDTIISVSFSPDGADVNICVRHGEALSLQIAMSPDVAASVAQAILRHATALADE